MSLPDNWSTVKVTAQYLDPDGRPAQGEVRFEMNTPRALNSDARIIVSSRPIEVDLDAEGRIEVMLPATNDPDVVPSFTWRVQESFLPNRYYSYEIEIPHDVTEIDLSHVDEVTSGQVVYRYVMRDGDTLTGHLTLHADPSDDLHAATKRYVDDSRLQSIAHTDSVLSAHLSADDPHGDRAWAQSYANSMSASSRSYTDTQLSEHTAAADPHGDRAHADGLMGSHLAHPDPHGSKAYADQVGSAAEAYADALLVTHVSSPDPHGDRAYAEEMASRAESNANEHTNSALSAHVAADDPHGDRMYADGLSSQTLGEAQAYADSALSGHLSASDPHGDRTYADEILSLHVTDTDPHGDRAYAESLASQAEADSSAYAEELLSDHEAAVDPHGDRAWADSRFLPASEVGESVASLVGGKVPSSQIPSIAITETHVVDSEGAMLSLDAQVGDIAIRTDVSRTYVLGTNDPTQAENWYQLATPPAPVESVNGASGVVVLGPSDVGADPAGSASTAVSAHIGEADPHGDRAYTDSALSDHLNAPDPHGDRAYAEATFAAKEHTHSPEQVGADPAGTASSVVEGHVSSTDPHGDRAYADATFVPLTQVGAVGGVAPLDASGRVPAANLPEFADGEDGNSVLSGQGAPDPTVGRDGDFYVDTTTWEIYGPKQTTWGSGTSLVGPQGEQGPPGEAGADGQDGTDGINGRSVLSGSVAPTTEGADGDFYINTSTWEIYGPKDGSWGDPTSLIGPEGPQGPQGEQGPPGEPGQDGLSLEKFYDVMAYGAVGDGISDDTAAIQQALDDCAAAGGGTVYLPAKTFSISSRLAIGANTVVWAYGATISRASGPLICNFKGSDLFSGYEGNGNIHLLGGTWNHNGTQHTSASNAINFVHAENIVVKDVTVLDVYSSHGLEFNAIRNGLAENCKFYGFIDPGNRSFSEAIQIDVAVSGSASIGHFDGTHCENITIRGCVMGPNPITGTGPYGRLVGSHTVSNGLHRRITVENCLVESSLDHGICGYGWGDVKISRNRVFNAGQSGIRVEAITGQQTSSVTISNNTVESSTIQGIYVAGETSDLPPTAVLVSNNTVRNITVGNTNAIRVDGSLEPIVEGNQTNVISGTALYVKGSPNALVRGNMIVDTGSNGINTDSSHGSSITGNTIKDCSSYAIVSSGASDLHISDNVIVGAGRNGTTPGAIRISTSGSDRAFITGNRVRKAGSGTETTRALSITSGMNDTIYTNNDFRGFGPEADAVQDLGTGSIKGTNYYQ